MKKTFSTKRLADNSFLSSDPGFLEWISSSISTELGKGIADVLSNGKEYIVQMRMKQFESPIAELQNHTEIRGSVSFEPLIRCKDCKHFNRNPDIMGYYECTHFNAEIDSDNSFCSYGERRENDDTGRENR